MLRHLTYVGCFGVVVGIVGVLCLQYQIVIGPVVLALTIVPLLGFFAMINYLEVGGTELIMQT